MALITCFNDLPDLVLIELFSYLSSYDILWGFIHLNQRLTMLIIERGFFYYINLSLSYYHQFNKILHFLPLNSIQSLAIDSDTSPLQLTRRSYLSSLTTLRIIGTYNHDDLLLFLLLHAATLTHLIIKSNERIIPLQIDSSIFADHRHVDVNFSFKLINCPQYINVTQYIPCGGQYRSREIVGATFAVNCWSDKSKWLTDGDPFPSNS
ncbi:unnamed protein product [Rotaria sp. Silwood2]|nr:unnamed protein product [Rotaria sp. Silwood2]CAF3000586.1 unnamed protein product [Rotaria sp. Silwood2]CAF3355679.1 unnamed protein product [Rotaria sp. Silwood2]CAF4374669.1 unnamed protein product [Rotaria sp. Silwood2]